MNGCRGIRGDENIVEDYLDHRNILLEVGRRWETDADGLLQLLSGLEEVVGGGGGGGYSNELYVVGGGESHLRNQCLGEGSVDRVAEGQRSSAFRDRCNIPDHNDSPLAVLGRNSSGGGGRF